MSKTRDGVEVTTTKIGPFDYAIHLGATTVRCSGGTFGKADADTLVAFATDLFSIDFAFICRIARKVARTERLTQENLLAARDVELSA